MTMPACRIASAFAESQGDSRAVFGGVAPAIVVADVVSDHSDLERPMKQKAGDTGVAAVAEIAHSREVSAVG